MLKKPKAQCILYMPQMQHQNKTQTNLIESEENNSGRIENDSDLNFPKIRRYEELMSNMIQNCLISGTKPHFIVSNKFINQWKDYCQSESSDPSEISPMNDDIFVEGKIKKGLKYRADYQVVNEAIYDLFKPFTDKESRNKRNACWHDDTRTRSAMPIYIFSCNYLILDRQILRKIDCGYIEVDDLAYRSISIKQNQPISIMLNQIGQNEAPKTDTYRFTLWQLQNQTEIQKIFASLRKKLCGLIFNEYSIENFGKLCDKLTIPLSQLSNGTDQLFFLIEQTQKDQKPIFIQNYLGNCKGCKSNKDLTVTCLCGNIKYCSDNCLNKDKSFHLSACSYAEEIELNKRVDMSRKPGRTLEGLVGLKNLFNTCYMNSCLQCLSNTTPLTEYFLNEYFEAEINKKNLLGTRGRLTKAYAKFIKAMWCQNEHIFYPTNIKDTVSKINPMFSGNAQHDAQEFLSFLIDGLHQDLNRIEKKPNAPFEQNLDKQESVMAQQSWKANLARNQSIITDLMTGQYRSVLTCSDCNKKSIKFEPFMTVSLPLSSSKITHFYMIYQYQYKKNMKHYFSYNNYDPNEWIRKACEAVKAKAQRCQLYLVSQKENIYKVGRQSLHQIAYKVQVENKNLFLIEKMDEEMQIPKDRVIEFTVVLIKLQEGKTIDIFFKFPMLFDRNSVSGYSITKRILKFVYNQAFKQKGANPIKHVNTPEYEEYEQKMIQKKILKIYLKLDKVIDTSVRKIQTMFNREIQLKNLQSVTDILKTQNTQVSNCEIEVRFDGQKTKEFNFTKLLKFDEPNAPALKKDQLTLEACFKSFADIEVLQAGNEWFCPECKSYKKAIKEINIYRAPQILVLQLKRFKEKGGRKSKDDAFVKFPFELNLEKYVLDQKPIQAYKQQLQNDAYVRSKCQNLPFINYSTKSKPIYELYAISNHMGEIGVGHYTAFVKKNGQWYEFNDSDVSEIQDANKIISKHAYLLFYQRKES